MILIDASCWIEYFRKFGKPHVKQRVNGVLGRGEAAYTCPIYFEILAGALDHEYNMVYEGFSYCQRVYFETEDWETSASIERLLRCKGFTVPRDDIFIAAVCQRAELPLMVYDKHFGKIWKHCGIKSELMELQ